MRKLTVIIFIISLVLLAANISYAYMFDDPVGDVWSWPGDPDAYDRIGVATFEIFGADIFLSGTDIVMNIYSNYPKTGLTVGSGINAWHTFPADLALDLDGDSIYEYGIAFTTHDAITKTGLYAIDTTKNTPGDIENGWYLSDYYKPSGGYIYHHNKKVTIAEGTLKKEFDVDWNAWAGDSDWQISLALSTDDFALSDWDGTANFFYGGANCANDFIGGTYPVPEPASLSLLGLGLLGLIGIRKKGRRQ